MSYELHSYYGVHGAACIALHCGTFGVNAMRCHAMQCDAMQCIWIPNRCLPEVSTVKYWPWLYPQEVFRLVSRLLSLNCLLSLVCYSTMMGQYGTDEGIGDDECQISRNVSVYFIGRFREMCCLYQSLSLTLEVFAHFRTLASLWGNEGDLTCSRLMQVQPSQIIDNYPPPVILYNFVEVVQ